MSAIIFYRILTSTYTFKRAFFPTRTSDRAQIWHACADRDETGSHQKNKLTHPTPGRFRGLSIDVCGCVCDDVCLFGGGCQLRLTYLFRRPVTLDRTQIWHACADRYSHLNKQFTHPTPGGFRVLSIDNKSFATDRAQIWHACADRYSHHKKIDPPHHRRV